MQTEKRQGEKRYTVLHFFCRFLVFVFFLLLFWTKGFYHPSIHFGNFSVVCFYIWKRFFPRIWVHNICCDAIRFATTEIVYFPNKYQKYILVFAPVLFGSMLNSANTFHNVSVWHRFRFFPKRFYFNKAPIHTFWEVRKKLAAKSIKHSLWAAWCARFVRFSGGLCATIKFINTNNVFGTFFL